MISFCKLVKRLGSLRGVTIDHMDCESKHFDISFTDTNRKRDLIITVDERIRIYTGGVHITCDDINVEVNYYDSNEPFFSYKIYFHCGVYEKFAQMGWYVKAQRMGQPENGVRYWG